MISQFHSVFVPCVACFCVLVGGFAFASSCEDVVYEKLRQQGIFVGFDSEKEEVVAIGIGRGKYGEAVFLLQRDQCFKAAELSAKRQIIQTLESASSGRRGASLAAGKKQRSAYELYADQQLTGWSFLDAAEKIEGADLVVAVALLWSPGMETRMRKMMEGSFRSATNWKDKARDFVKSCSSLPTSLVFTDEEGCPHLLGVGVSQLSHDSQLLRDRAMKWADAFARKNLILAMKGTTCSCEAFDRRRDEKISAGGSDVMSSLDYGSVADLHFSGEIPAGLGPLLGYVKDHPSGGQKCFVSVWEYDPSESQGNCEVREADIRTPARSEGCVKVLNPITGKFE